MKRSWPAAAKILTGFLFTAVCAMPQNYTISAKAGAVNYVEGNAFLNGRPISPHNLKATFVNANDTISTDIGKAEVLLSPGVFLRLGSNTQVRMISASLTDTQLEVKSGEAMVEADDIVKDNQVTVVDGGGSAVIDRNGLYKFTAGAGATASVLEGKTVVYFDSRKTELGKGHEVLLGEAAKPKKFDAKKEDDLYAWSNVRSEYNAASSYQASKDVNASSYGGVWGGYGFSGFSNAGWMWNSGFNSYSWLPGAGAYYSPFGYGFYSPGTVGYAPVIYAPVYGGGGWGRRGVPTAGGGGTVARAAVPVNPVRPPALGGRISSPMANQAARAQSLRSYSSSGFRTGSGMAVPAGRAAAGFGGASHAAAGASASHGGFSGGGYSGGGHAGGFSGASAGGGGHAGGGSPAGSGGGGHH